MDILLYLKMADALRESGLDLIREYIPDFPVYNHIHLSTGQLHLSTHLQLSPVFLSWMNLKKLLTSSLLIHQHHPNQMVMFPWMFHPVDQPNFILHQCIQHQMHPSSFIQNPLDHHRVCHTCTHKQGHTSRANVIH